MSTEELTKTSSPSARSPRHSTSVRAYKAAIIPTAENGCPDSSIMTMSRLLSKSATRAASTASQSQTTKAAGDISSVFPSLRPDYKPEPLPPRFQDLKWDLFKKNEKAIRQSWERLLPSLEEEVKKIKAKGSDVSIVDLRQYSRGN